MPAPLIPDRWSLQAPYGSDFSNATVTVTENGVAQQVEILSNSGLDYGGQAIVWDMPDAPAPQPGQQVVYAVQVDNVVINGQSQSFSYTTTSFDPSTTTELTPVPAAIGFLQTSAQVGAAAGSITIDVACSMNTDPAGLGRLFHGRRHRPGRDQLCCHKRRAHFRARAVLQPDRRSAPAGHDAQPGGTFSVTLSAPSGATVGPIGSFQVTVTPLQLVVSEPVGDVVAGSDFDLQFSAEDALGNVDTAYDGPMTFQLTNAAGDQLTGNGYFVDGVADFDSVTLDWIGSYIASVTSGTVTTTTPNAFTVITYVTASAVQSLPATTTSTSFTVSWSGRRSGRDEHRVLHNLRVGRRRAVHGLPDRHDPDLGDLHRPVRSHLRLLQRRHRQRRRRPADADRRPGHDLSPACPPAR